MERLRPKIKLKGAANNKAADSVESERSQDQFRGAPANPDANVGQGEGFFPVLTGGIKRKRGPRTGERRTKEKQRFTFSRGSAVPSVPGDEEEFSDQDENESKEDVEVDVKMTDQRQVTTASNGLITESVEVKGAQSFQQKQGHLKVRVKASKLQEGSSTSEKQKVNDNENANSPEALKECQKPDLKQLEKPSSLMLKAARSLDQPSTPRQSRSSKSNEMASSPHQNEIEKLHINSENQEKDMVEILEGLHQRHRRQSHAVEKGQNDQSEYNAKELKDALMVVKKIMKMDAAEPFNTPVNPVALGIPDYFDIIDTPMDLGTVCSALERGEKYMNSRDVFKDIQFIWENCYKYNSKGDPILDLMKRVKKNFVKYWTAAGLYYESPKRTTETEHEGGDNPDGNEDPQSGKTKFIESVQSCLRSPKSRDEQVEQVIPMSEAREQVYEKNVEATQVQQCVKELDTEMDILQPPQTDPVVKTKGMKLRFKKSKSEHEQEKTASITEKTDGISIGTDEESGPKVGDSAQSFEEDAQQKDLNVKAKTRRRHGKYHHKDGCLCAVCNAKRRRHEREENAQLAKNQSTMVDVDLSEKMKEKVSVFLEKPLGEQGRTKPEYASNTNLIAKPEEQEHKAKVETRKHKVKAELKDEQESYMHEGRETHGKESRKAQLQVEHGLQMQWENEEQKKESETQQEEDEKESLMQEADEEQQQEGKDLQNQDEVQQEEARGKMQEEAGTPLQEGDIQQEGEFGRCYPADYEIPVQYASPSIMQICEVLFTRNHYSVWNRAHSLTCEPSKTISENKILAAISTLME